MYNDQIFNSNIEITGSPTYDQDHIRAVIKYIFLKMLYFILIIYKTYQKRKSLQWRPKKHK